MNTSRREFIKAGVAGGAALLLATPLKAHAGATIRLSACDWSLGVASQPEGLDTAKAIGLDGLEISATDEPKEVLKIADPDYRAAYKAAMDRTGLVISSVAMGLLNGCPLASDARGPAWLEQTIDGAADLHAKVILLAFFSDGDLLKKKGLFGRGGELKEKELDIVIGRVREAAPRAAKAGVILGLENTLSGAQNLAILEKIQSDAVKVYYDVGNSTYNGYDVAAEIRNLGNRICQIHFKDGGNALGEGDVDMDAVAKAMNDINYNGWVTLETAIKDNDRDGSFRKNAAFARGMFSKA